MLCYILYLTFQIENKQISTLKQACDLLKITRKNECVEFSVISYQKKSKKNNDNRNVTFLDNLHKVIIIFRFIYCSFCFRLSKCFYLVIVSILSIVNLIILNIRK